jgi:hypothetical protein
MRAARIAAAATVALAVTAARGASVDELAWLAGSWRLERAGVVVEEHWLPPAGGTMLGVNRTVRGDGRTAFEFLRIAPVGGVPAYLASPGGAPPTPFRLIEVEGTRATFENLEHDFPQRIVYQRDGERLTATISGTVDGVERSSSWEWRLDERPLGARAATP